jgi:hypothetical protein
MSYTTDEYMKAKDIVATYEKSFPITKRRGKGFDPKNYSDLIQLLTGKKLGEKFGYNFAYHKRYRNDFEGDVENPGVIQGIDSDGQMLSLKFYTGGSLFPNNTRDAKVSYKYINQTTQNYCDKYRLCTDKEFILTVISEQMFQHFIAWYGPAYRGNCTNMYRIVENVIDDWNVFVIKSKLPKKHRLHIVKIFKKFGEKFYDEMPESMKQRIGTEQLEYRKLS